ncbi:MAPK-interacting and spindle-stabilizing protein-like [Penaeus japonicus]|uniref:MAPK-interacting and spindle-stabilizing protein-like n=1 Tax=Penaeus japonicus TaxID=27405 RepID=UPI001C70FC36|nr:MAPK-interacting and spindle-stabilizing protein-like [Penaeus japonicus]
MSLLFTLKMFYIPLIMIIVFFSAGGFLIHLYITARRKAKREFDALPADHPDRLKYGGILLPGSVAASYPTANVYHFPSNAQGLGVAGPLAAAASSAPPSPGQQGSSAKGSDPPGGYPHQGPYAPPQGQYPPPQGPSAPPPGSTAKYDDDPPPYSEI